MQHSELESSMVSEPWESHLLRALSKRVENLERQNRKLKQTVILAAIILGSLLVMGQVAAPKGTPVKAVKTLDAGKFILRDGRGKMRAELSLFADRPALVFYNDASNATLSLGAEPEGAGLTLYGSDSQKAAALNYAAAGPVLTLYGAGNKRLNVSVGTQGPAIGLLGRNGEAKAALGLTAEDSAFLHLFGEGEHGGAQLLAAPDRTVLRFFDPSDRARAVFGIVEKESSPGLVLNDEAGVARTILMLTSQGPGMEFFDQNRQRIWIAR